MEKDNKNYDFEQEIKNQEENAGKVQNEAVVKAKEQMQQKKLQRDADEVQRRLEKSERQQEEAVKAARFASKKKNILKKYSEELNAAKTEFEQTGDYRAYDKKMDEIMDTKDKAIEKAKTEVYGDDAWRY